LAALSLSLSAGSSDSDGEVVVIVNNVDDIVKVVDGVLEASFNLLSCLCTARTEQSHVTSRAYTQLSHVAVGRAVVKGARAQRNNDRGVFVWKVIGEDLISGDARTDPHQCRRTWMEGILELESTGSSKRPSVLPFYY
jgi:hypothetical protein